MSVFSLIKPLAYISLPVVVLHTLSNSSPVVKYYVRLGLYLSTLGVCSIWGAIVAVSMNVIGDKFNTNWVVGRSFYAITSRLYDINVVVEGEEHLDTRPSILVGNHQSMLDLIYLGKVFPKRTSIMAKKELQYSPLLGQFMWLSGAVFVDRGNNAQAVRSLHAAGETIKARNTSLWVFPEGTRSMREHHDMLPFKKGAFHLAVDAGVPIVPVVCENYSKVYGKGIFGSGTLKVKVLPPVATTGLTSADVAALSIRVHDMMVNTLREISYPILRPGGDDKQTPSAPSSAQTPQPAAPQDPLAHVLPSVTEAGPDATTTTPLGPESRSESRASEVSEDFSSPPSSRHGYEGSEAGAETEEDEGMVLVGRPPL